MNRIEEINKQINELQKELLSIQEACSHPPVCVRYKYESDTGNWDRGSDTYWTRVRCTLCQKRWTVEGSLSFDKAAKRIERGEEL